MSNALKFTSEGTISAEFLNDDVGEVTVVVKDSGIGIKQDDLENLFEPFQQINMDYTKSYKGTGLGLYLSKQLSSVIGGRIMVESYYGEGSQFSLVLPTSIDGGR